MVHICLKIQRSHDSFIGKMLGIVISYNTKKCLRSIIFYLANTQLGKNRGLNVYSTRKLCHWHPMICKSNTTKYFNRYEDGQHP